MIVKELYLSHFGKFQEKDITLKSGLNVIYGGNEAGKSTIHSFIRGMLFGIERQRGRISKEDLYFRYLPWKTKGIYDGYMDIVAGNHEYRLVRNFYKTTKEFRIIDLDTGRELSLDYSNIKDIIPSLSESVYRNTVSIEQLRAHTGEDLAREVQNYIANLSISKTSQVNVSRALQQLQAKKKQIESELNQLNTHSISHDLERSKTELSKVDQLNEQLLQYEKLERQKKKEKEEFLKEPSQKRDLTGDKIFEEMRAKFDECIELNEQCERLNNQYNQYTKMLNDLLRVENAHKTIYQDIEEINHIHGIKNELDHKLSELRSQEQEAINRCNRRCRFRNFIPFLCAMVGSLIVLPNTSGISLVVILLALSIVFYLYRQHEKQHMIQNIEEKESELDRKFLELEARKRDIFLRNNVTGDAELRYKLQMLRQNVEELNESRERRQRIEKEQIRIYSKKELIEKDILKYASIYFDQVTISKELMSDLEYEVNLRKENAEKTLASIEQEYEEVVVKLERVKWELSNYDEFEEELQRKQKQFEELIESKSKLEKELEAITLAIDSIESLSMDIHDSFGNQINKRLSELIGVISNGMYTSAKLDEHLHIKVLKGLDYVDFEKLSAGAVSEIYLALRITISDLLTGTKFLPLILDEAFVLYDDQRLKATLSKLSNLADRQIIIFTCHKRERELLEELGIEYNYIDLGES